MLNLLLGLMMIHSINGTYFIENEPFLKFEEAQLPNEQILTPKRVNLENVGVKITADKYFVLDVKSGKVLAENNSNIPQPIASITKVMTALVILDENPNWQKQFF